LGEAELEEFCNFDDEKIIMMETELIVVQWTSKQYLNFMFIVLACRMVEELELMWFFKVILCECIL